MAHTAIFIFTATVKAMKLIFYLLIVNGPDIFPVEIKAGMTITRDYFKGLKHFAALFKDQMPDGSGLVYAGNESQKREDVSIEPFYNLAQLFCERG